MVLSCSPCGVDFCYSLEWEALFAPSKFRVGQGHFHVNHLYLVLAKTLVLTHTIVHSAPCGGHVSYNRQG